MGVLKTTFYTHFHFGVALFKLDFLRDECAESLASWNQIIQVKLRIVELPLLNHSYTAFEGVFLEHPVIKLLLTLT